MAMTINPVQLGQLGQVASTTSRAGALFDPARQRLSQTIESTQVQLSSYGQVRSSFAATQNTAQALTATAANSKAGVADVRKAVQGFVDAFNQSAKTASAAVKQNGALGGQTQAVLANADLAGSLTAGGGVTDLRQLGVTRSQDGTLTLDAAALEKAYQSNPTQVRSALTELGQQVDNRLGSELAAGGNIGSSVATLTKRAQSLATQQANQEARISSSQQTVQQSSQQFGVANATNYAVATGLAAYHAWFGG